MHIYIDGNNLYRAATELGYQINYKKFRGWLRQKYNPTVVYLFIGRIQGMELFYQKLESFGYVLIFKQTVTVRGSVKGNCDAELVLRCVSDYYTDILKSGLLITGDGDFGCLVEFLKTHNVPTIVVAPHSKKCSILLKNKNVDIRFLDEHYHKFSDAIKEKAPDADVSA